MVIVNKYKAETGWVYGFNSKMGKKVQGIKNCYILKEDLKDSWKEKTYPKGAVILDGTVITPINDKNDYYYELKTTGNSFSGNLQEFNELLDTVREIEELY